MDGPKKIANTSPFKKSKIFLKNLPFINDRLQMAIPHIQC